MPASGSIPSLSTDLDRDDVQPYFIWDVPVTVGELRRHLRDPDPGVRVPWMARVMREARYWDVWRLVTLDQVLGDWDRLRRHLGRRRRFWDFLIEGWRRDGLHTERVDPEPVTFGAIRVDSLREIAANKICTLIGRAEIRDLVDLAAILATGATLEQALSDAARKDASADPATLAWLLDELTIPPGAPLPGGGDAAALDAFRADLVERLRRLALPGATSA